MRWSAARALGGRCRAVPALAAALGRGAGAARARSDHDRAHADRRRGKRQGAAALSALAGRRPARPPRSKRCRLCRTPSRRSWRRCLRDADSDVRILATELARNMPAADATRVLCGLAGARAASQCLRGGDRSAGRGRHARRRSRRCELAPNALPARRSCRSPRRSPSRGFPTARLAGMARSRRHGRSRRPRHARRTFGRLCEFLYRRTGMSVRRQTSGTISIAALRERIAATGSASFQSYFALLRADAEQRDRASRQRLHGERDLFLPRGPSAPLHDIGPARQPSSAGKRAGRIRSASGRFPARPAKSPIRSRSG